MAKIPKNGRVQSLVRGTAKMREFYYARIEWVDEEGYRVIGDVRALRLEPVPARDRRENAGRAQ